MGRFVWACCAIAFALVSVDASVFNRQPRPKAPSVEDNQRLLAELDNEIAEADKLLGTHQAAVSRSLALKYAKAIAPPDVAEMIKVVEAADKGRKARIAFDSKEYSESIYTTTVALFKIMGGVAGGTAAAFDLFRKVVETAIIVNYQASLLDQRWKLPQAIQYGRFKDPQNQAEFRRVLDRISANVPSQRAVLRLFTEVNASFLRVERRAGGGGV